MLSSHSASNSASASASASAASSIASLLHASNLPSIHAAAQLDLDTCIPIESIRSRQHMDKLKQSFIDGETKQRFLTSLVSEEDQTGANTAAAAESLFTAIKDTCNGVDHTAIHQQTLAALTLKNDQTVTSVDEIHHHTRELEQQIRDEIKQLINTWNAVETGKEEIAAAREEINVQTESFQWKLAEKLWQSVQHVMSVVDKVDVNNNMQALDEAYQQANQALSNLNASFSMDANRSSGEHVDQMAVMVATLDTQVQQLFEWGQRIADLKSSIHTASQHVPKIASFKQASLEAMESGVQDAVPESQALKSARTGLNTLSKLSGVVILKSNEEEVRSEHDLPSLVTRLTVCVKALQPYSIPASSSSSPMDIYSSPDAFAAAVLNSSPATTDSGYYVLDLTLAKVTEATPGLNAAQPDAMMLLKGKLIGLLPCSVLDTIAATRSMQSIPSSQANPFAADHTFEADVIEQRVLSIPSNSHVHEVTQLIQYAVTMKNPGEGVSFLLRQLPFVMQQQH